MQGVAGGAELGRKMTGTTGVLAFRPRSERGLLCLVGVLPLPKSQRGLQSADTAIWG